MLPLCLNFIILNFACVLIRNYEMDLVSHYLQLRQTRIIFSLLRGPIKSIAHDGDQHVQEGDLDEERRENEENVDE